MGKKFEEMSTDEKLAFLFDGIEKVRDSTATAIDDLKRRLTKIDPKQ